MIYVFFSFLARGTTITAVKTIASSHKTFRVRDSKRNTNVLRRIIAYIICTHTHARTHIHIPSTIIASSRLNFHRENANDTSEKESTVRRSMPGMFEWSSNRFRSIDEQAYSFLRWFRRCISSSHPIAFIFRGKMEEVVPGGKGEIRTRTHERSLKFWRAEILRGIGGIRDYYISISRELGLRGGGVRSENELFRSNLCGICV